MCRRIAILLLLIVLGLNIYRAWTQSITADEAFAESLFLNGHISRLFNSYDASHHVLHTLLTKLSVLAFGLSEFTLRLPSLLGGLFYLATLYRLTRHVFGGGGQFLLAFALAGLNPLVLDHLSAARGYGLALALFLWSLHQMLLYSGGDHDTSRVLKAGLGLGLSVAANLTLLVPATALAVLFLLVLVRSGRLSAALDAFVVPGIVTAFVIVVLPLTKATREHFYVGLASVGESLRLLVALSMFHHPLDPRVSAVLPQPDFWYALFGYLLAPAVLAAAGAAASVVLWRWWRGRRLALAGGPARFLLLGGGSLVLSVGILVALHGAMKVLYPYARTGLYLIPLFTLTALALPASLGTRRRASRLVGGPLWAVGAFTVLIYLLQLPTKVYGEWTYDSSTKDIVNLIRDRQRERPLSRVRVGITWMLEPSINFYRRIYSLDWLAPVERKDPDGDYDYFALLEADAALIKKRGLRVLFHDPAAGVYLAEPAGLRQSYR